MSMDHRGLFQMRCLQESSRPVCTAQSCSLFCHMDLGLSWKIDFLSGVSFSSVPVSTAHIDTLSLASGGVFPAKQVFVTGADSPPSQLTPARITIPPNTFVINSLSQVRFGFCTLWLLSSWPDTKTNTLVFRNLLQVKEWVIIRRGNNSQRFGTIHTPPSLVSIDKEAIITWLLFGISEMI